MALRYRGILTGSFICLVAGAAIYLLAVTGLLFEQPTPAGDIGLYSVTAVLLGFGVGGLLLRASKIKENPTV